MSYTEDVLDLESIRKIAVQACDGDETLELISHHLELYSKTTVGFLGSHRSLEITVKRRAISSEPVKLKFFVKLVPHSSVELSSFIKQRRVFNHEAEFFNKVMPHLLEATSVADVETWAPECYLANDEVIVLEDLRAKGFAMNKFKVLDDEYLKAAVRTMARLHAASILAERRLGGKRLDELYPDACREQIFTDDMLKLNGQILQSLIVDVAKKSGRVCEKLRQGLERSFEFVSRGGRREQRVVCHGDAWPNNAMLTDAGNSEPRCRLVDYQIVRYAPRMFDVAELVCLSTSKQIREREENQVLEAYWTELCETLRKCDPEAARPSLEEIKQEYDEAKLAGLVNALLYYPTILLGEEVYEEYADDQSTLYKKFVFRLNNDCILEHMDKDEVYAKRITETVLEFLDGCEKEGSNNDG